MFVLNHGILPRIMVPSPVLTNPHFTTNCSYMRLEAEAISMFVIDAEQTVITVQEKHGVFVHVYLWVGGWVCVCRDCSSCS